MFLWRLFRRLFKALFYLVVIIILIPIAGVAYGFMTTDPIEAMPLPGVADSVPPAVQAAKLRDEIPGYQRAEEATFLTYPEWVTVYAARDYAGYTKGNLPSGFPYWSYIGHFWQDYATAVRASHVDMFDLGNHQMLVVTGTSLTIEHAIQWTYENTIGRLTEMTAGGRTVADDYQAKVATDYAASLDKLPWYDFPYADKRAGLMALKSPAGEDPYRTMERRWAFGLASWIKQGYADLFKKALATSNPAGLDIHVWAKGPVGETVRSEPDTFLEQDLGADGVVFVTKRQRPFTEMIPRLIARGITFVEIGGNDEILVTVLSGDGLTAPEGAFTLFTHRLPLDSARRRSGMVVAVRRLHTVLPALTAAGAQLEHIFDY